MKREEKWELLRAISCVSVLLLHVAALYTEEPEVYRQYAGMGFSFCDFLQIMTRTAVPCFVMLSGAFLLDKQHLDAAAFYRTSIRKLMIPTLGFELLYMGVSACGGNPVQDVLYGAVTGNIAGHLWFMFMLMELYAVFPILYTFKRKASQKQFAFFSFSMIAVSCLIHFTCKLIWPLQFLEFLGYFLTANYIRNNGKRFPGSAGLWLLISGGFLLITFALNEYRFYDGTYDAAFYRNPNFPTVIAASLAMFTAFSKLEIKHMPRLFERIAKHSMFLYMLHPLVINVIRKVLIELFSGTLPSPFFCVPVVFVVCFAVTYIASAVADRALKSANAIVRKHLR